VTVAYAGACAFLARKQLVRLREAAPSLPDVTVQDEPVQDAKQELGSAKRRAKSAAKSHRSRPVAPSRNQSHREFEWVFFAASARPSVAF
jgi:hypothetical protein